MATAIDTRKRSSDEIILACKEFGCPWDPYPHTVQEQARRGGWFWFRKIRCLNCGSLKVEKYPVGDARFKNRIGKAKYDRPPGWYDDDLRVYWGAAREERARLGYLETVAQDADADAEADANVVELHA